MKVRIYDYAKDNTETLRGEAWLDDCIPDDDDRWFVAQELRNSGRCWIGGGAAPLVCLFRADRT